MKKKLFIMACALFMCANVFAQTQWTVNNTASWQTAVNGIANGGNNRTHTVTVSGTVSVPGTTQWLFGDATGITVTLQGSGTLALSSNGCLLAFSRGKTVVVRDITLQGRDGNDYSVVYIGGGTFRMEGNASIRNNSGNRGVLVDYGGTFTMEGGTISGNSSKNWSGGAVYIGGGGSFTMRGGIISGNTVWGQGGGVAVGENSSFTLVGGTISGNTSYSTDAIDGDALPGKGGGVYINSGGTFTMQGGTISGNRAGSENNGYAIGAGVFVAVDGTFIMQNGTISGNIINNDIITTSEGGGVYIEEYSWVNRCGTFIKTGGTIYGSNETNAAFRNSSRIGHAVYFGNCYRDTTLPANASGNISTTSALPTASGQTLNNWTMK